MLLHVIGKIVCNTILTLYAYNFNIIITCMAGDCLLCAAGTFEILFYDHLKIRKLRKEHFL